MTRRIFLRFHGRLSALAFALLAPLCGLRSEVLVVGDALARDPRLVARLKASGHALKTVPAAELVCLNSDRTEAVVLASDGPLPPEIRPALNRYLAKGGRVAVVGAHLFDYAPRIGASDTLSRFETPEACRIVEIARKITNPEPLLRETTQAPDGKPALVFRTAKRGMESFFVEFDAGPVRSARRNVLRFWARGDSYADLLVVVIRDTAGRDWYGFVPLANGDWRRHALSLADCLPEGWKTPEDPHPSLDPAAIATIRLGVNRNTVWNEKPMALALGTVELGEDINPNHAPTSGLSALRLPFLEIGIAAPSWIFDPFAGAVPAPAKTLLSNAAEPSTKAFPMPAGARLCPPPHIEHPGPRMGTDNNKTYMLKFSRETRRQPLWVALDADGRTLGNVAEFRFVATGQHRGSALLLVGLPQGALLAEPTLAASFIDALAELVAKPAIASVTPDVKASAEGKTAAPTLAVVVQNPTRALVRGTVRAGAAAGALQGEAQVAIPARGSATVHIALPPPSERFPFAHFEWTVELQTPAGTDTLRDTVDVERALLHALRHMASTQRQFPDGRISNHYFGDAYGVRAMYTYLALLKREPSRLRNHADLRAELPVSAIETCANRFFDMLVDRQTDEGAVPMGYGENTPVYNVADCGQMALSVGQVIPLISDETRRARYLRFCKRFASWAESYYIDEALSAELQKRLPDKARETKAGHYGLGLSRGVRQQNGPSWVMPDVLGAQIVLARLDPSGGYERIARRNWRNYLAAGYPSSGYFQAEALVWAWLATDDPDDRARIARSLRDDFLEARLRGDIHEMYERGARSNLNALPLQYYRRYFEDTPAVRSLLLKYIWAFASENAPNSMRRVAETFPKPQHGESIAAVKQASTGALWAMELLDPGSSLLRLPDFPPAKTAK